MNYFCLCRVCTLLDNIRGDLTSSIAFTTLSCEPEKPIAPKLINRTKTSITLKWTVSVFIVSTL